MIHFPSLFTRVMLSLAFVLLSIPFQSVAKEEDLTIPAPYSELGLKPQYGDWKLIRVRLYKNSANPYNDGFNGLQSLPKRDMLGLLYEKGPRKQISLTVRQDSSPEVAAKVVDGEVVYSTKVKDTTGEGKLMLKVAFQGEWKTPVGLGRILVLDSTRPKDYLEDIYGNVGVFRLDGKANANDHRGDHLSPAEYAAAAKWEDIKVPDWAKTLSGLCADFAKAFAAGQ